MEFARRPPIETISQASDATPEARHRPDIDGLRAIAVLSVLVYHAFPGILRSGFVGVDIFFVISGFLISSILLRDANHGCIRFFGFYRRRINRIFPALILVLAFVLAAGYWILFPTEYHALGADVASGAGFSSNLSLLGEAGYFDRDAVTKPLLHLWSLAVEEQFYIFWPVVIWAADRARFRTSFVLATFAACSFAWNIVQSINNPVVDFYSPFTRFWEPAFGAVLAATYFETTRRFRTHSNLMSVGGLAAIAIASLVAYGTPYPGAMALLPVLGAVLIIAAGPSALINRNVLSLPGLRWIGNISYPLYLWHWPLLAFARILYGTAPPLVARVTAVTAAFALAALTHYAIEDPMRFGRFPRRKMAVAVAGMAAVAIAGQITFLRHGLPARAVVALNPQLATADAGGPGPGILDHCYERPQNFIRTDGCQMDARETPRVALIGDSKAGALASGAFRTSHSGNRWLYMGNNRARGNYLSATLLSQNTYPDEFALTRYMLDTVDAHPEIHSVVIADATRTLFHLHDTSTIDDLPQSLYGAPAFAAITPVINELLHIHRQVYIVADNPTLGHPEDCIGRITALPWLNQLMGLPTTPPECAMPYTRFVALTRPYSGFLARLTQAYPGRVHVVPTADIFCNIHVDVCPMMLHGRLLYGYSDHASDYAAGLVGARLNAIIDRDATKVKASPSKLEKPRSASTKR